jgi:hypothetical protein
MKVTKQGWVSLQFLLYHAPNLIKKLTSLLFPYAWKEAIKESTQQSFYPVLHLVWIFFLPYPNISKL